ncbi:MAG: nucleotide exchange factor GrpE [Selenomonadaceae bacterium]|nr:nucleotide exchange factor GrpE [Selenomonadaceae bacterium]MBQ6132362.1 nucleotide exchange factor GrpE [Selenomonadaceae bacterium]
MDQPAPEVEEIDTAAELENLKAELNAKDDRLIRLQADFDNFRKRTAREQADIAAVVEQAFLKDLLPLLDNLSRASDAMENADVETLRKGIEMIKQETVAVMGKHGLEPIEALDKPFDPNFHQAVGTVKDDSKADGTVAAEFQRGYIARGRVIRPSMVQVVNNS